MIPGQSSKMFEKLHLNGKTLGVAVCACHPSNFRKLRTRALQPRLAWAKSETVFPK
jgi:hypothetical protein